MQPFAARIVSGWSDEPVIVLAFTAEGHAVHVSPDGVVNVLHNVEDYRLVADSWASDWAASQAFRAAWDKEHQREAALT